MTGTPLIVANANARPARLCARPLSVYLGKNGQARASELADGALFARKQHGHTPASPINIPTRPAAHSPIGYAEMEIAAAPARVTLSLCVFR
jgi:hypothetical protein